MNLVQASCFDTTQFPLQNFTYISSFGTEAICDISAQFLKLSKFCCQQLVYYSPAPIYSLFDFFLSPSLITCII
jgi:hypothetical protein